MKYSKNFERDFKWFIRTRNLFTFDGSTSYINKKGESIVQFDKNGIDGKQAFYLWDSQGKIVPTKHPRLLYNLLKIKGSINLHIQMYAEDLAAFTLTGLEVRAFCIKHGAPYWFREAITKQRYLINGSHTGL